VVRSLVVLVLLSVFTVGLLDRSLLVIFPALDRPYAAFLSGIALTVSVCVRAWLSTFVVSPECVRSSNWRDAAP
jgi:hypothetical protein